MARFRNTTNGTLFIPEGSPQSVPADGLFDVPDDRADAFEAQPNFAPAAPAKPKTKQKEGE